MKYDLSPIEQFVGETTTGERDLVEDANVALSRANGNLSGNTYISLDREWTLDQARQQISRCSQMTEKPLLYGLPVALKDCFDLAGFKTSAGSKFYATHKQIELHDSAVAARLKQAGAVITGKTHLHQLAYGITGENPDYGDCRQPADPTLLTGGSSSGAAASIQEGSALAAIGTDTGGSIRVPAALCGLAGYRASHGLGDWRGGAHLAPSFDTIGWLFQDLRDAMRLARTLFDLPTAPVTSAAIRIGFLADGILDPYDGDVAASFEICRELLAATGIQLISSRADFFRDAYSIYAPIQAYEAAQLHAGFYDQFDPAIAERLYWGASLSDEEIQYWRARHREFFIKTKDLFAGFDFLLMPATPVSRLVAGADHATSRPRILAYTTPASLAGLPTIVLPSAGCGMQLLAAHNHDAPLLRFAGELGAYLAAG